MPQTIYIKDYDQEVEIPDGADMLQVQAALKKQFPQKSQPSQQPKETTVVPKWGRDNPNLYGVAGAARETIGPIIEALGAGAGGLAGALATPELLGAGALPGAGLGYAGARQATGAMDEALGNKPPSSLAEAAKMAVSDIGTGAEMEAGGQIAGKVIPAAMNLAGKGMKQVLGSTTGAGAGTMDEALKGSKAFKDAMRGKISGDEIVDNTAAALKTLKEQRGAAYRAKLEEISKNKEPLDISPVKNKLMSLLKQYGVRKADPATMVDTGKEFDFSRSVFGKSASKDVEEITNMINQWGSKEGDNTPVMLDTLKRRLGDFYSDSSQARQLVSALESEVKGTITKAVPQYGEMTKGYKEATDLIKDVEKGLMLKKGMTADQTLRRLTSAMRENFEMRRDLVNVLGEKSGKDLPGQIAGYAASQIKPRGLMGSGPGMLGIAAYAHYLNPKFWPILAASSPRAVGEFMSVYGKGLAEAQAQMPGGSQAAYKALGYGAGKVLEGDRKYPRKGDLAALLPES